MPTSLPFTLTLPVAIRLLENITLLISSGISDLKETSSSSFSSSTLSNSSSFPNVVLTPVEKYQVLVSFTNLVRSGAFAGVVTTPENHLINISSHNPLTSFNQAVKAFKDMLVLLKESDDDDCTLSLVVKGILSDLAIEEYFVGITKTTSINPKEEEIPVVLHPNPKAGGYVTISGKKVSWSGGCYGVYVDKEMTEGIYKIEIYSTKTSSSSNYPYIGLASKSVITNTNNSYYYIYPGSCMIYQNGYYVGSSQPASHSDSSFQNNGTLTMELNLNRNTLHFIMNEKLMPHYVSNIPSSVYFHMAGYTDVTCEIRSLKRLTFPTVDEKSGGTAMPWK